MTKDLEQDIKDTGETILNILEKFHERHGYDLEVEYKNKKFRTQLVINFPHK